MCTLQLLPTARIDRSDEVDAITDALLTASRALVAVAARSLAAVDDDVTLPQYRALVVLASHGPRSAGELSDALGVHPSTATRLCDRIVAKGLVDRGVASDSRREVTIALSDEGRRIVAAVTERRRVEIEQIVERIPQRHRRSMIAALAAFAHAAGEVPQDSWLGWP